MQKSVTSQDFVASCDYTILVNNDYSRCGSNIASFSQKAVVNTPKWVFILQVKFLQNVCHNRGKKFK